MPLEKGTDKRLVAHSLGSSKIYRLGKNRRKSHMFVETTSERRRYIMNFNIKVSFQRDYEINLEWVIDN